MTRKFTSRDLDEWMHQRRLKRDKDEYERLDREIGRADRYAKERWREKVRMRKEDKW